jgi:hypothetical protein
MNTNAILTLLIIVAVAIYMLLWPKRLARREMPALRPLDAFTALKGQVSRAIESAQQLHVGLGRASLTGPAAPTSVAALALLDKLATDGCSSDTPPITTVGEATLLPLAENNLRAAAAQSRSKAGIPIGTARFIASKENPYAYAGGVASVVQQEKILGSVMVGQFGQELAIVTDAASRTEVQQIIGSDDPLALAVAAPLTENLLIGEELLAAPAYLSGRPDQVASLQLQDVLRVVISLALLGLALFALFAG